ncbi:MAG TPA: 2-(1,2-epoxy-1,2-dihydrophenyl)acetyl-CoA isomerase PaaG [Candidatus Acidoferrales bacterium]|nr:2-(1,2-epoxy-1,2-dihydrophenyl)acetyl-CoA isomerase PaaG [Candidatus Acidoferrales bacterium]
MNLLVAREGGIMRVTLDRPDKLNAIDGEMASAARAAFEAAAREESVRVVVLTGSGQAFCAGQNLADSAIAPGSDLGLMIERYYNPLIRAIRSLPKPVIARVNGVAAGAGANLAFAADIVVAARSASFIESFSRVGLLPDSGGTWMLPRLFGHARAVALAMLGERISAEQAHAWGAIWDVVDDNRLDQACDTLAKTLAQAPTRALGAIKAALEAGAYGSLDAALDRERDLQRILGATADYREGVGAFREKRKPDFEGR